MQKKIVFLDIDGTFLTMGHLEPPASAIKAIQIARKNGHLVFICTGRSHVTMKSFLQYGFDGFVASAGGYVCCGENVIYDCPIEQERVQKTTDLLQEHNILINLDCHNKVYADDRIDKILLKQTSNGRCSELEHWKELTQAFDVEPLSLYRGEPVYAITVMTLDQDSLLKVHEHLEGFELCVYDFIKNGFINAELVNQKFNKGTAVKMVCEYYDIPIDNAIAIGDSMNDFEMIRISGVGICMADSVAKLKEVADDICPPSDKDGIFHAFKKYGLLASDTVDI